MREASPPKAVETEAGADVVRPTYDIVTGLDDAVDIVIGGHNNQRFVCMDVEGKAVTMAYWSGRMFHGLRCHARSMTKDITVQSIDNRPTAKPASCSAADVTALIDKYDTLVAPLADQVIGTGVQLI